MIKYIMTFELPIEYALDHNQRIQAMRALNKHFTGKEQIPMEEKVPEALKDAAWRVCANNRTTITVGVTFDGHVEIINE